jgi:hypothetical protein
LDQIAISGMRQISTADDEHWKKEISTAFGALLQHGMDTLRLVLDCRQDDPRLILDHPAEHLQKKKIPKTKAVIPASNLEAFKEWNILTLPRH